jgi:hypothetical protein
LTTTTQRALRSMVRGGIIVRPPVRKRLLHGRGIRPEDIPHVYASLQADVERIVKGRRP